MTHNLMSTRGTAASDLLVTLVYMYTVSQPVWSCLGCLGFELSVSGARSAAGSASILCMNKRVCHAPFYISVSASVLGSFGFRQIAIPIAKITKPIEEIAIFA